MAVFNYGADSTVSLELAAGAAPLECGIPRGRPPEDLAAAVSEALQEPLDYPPLARSTTPGDRVALALQDGVPQVAQVTAAVVRSLVESGVDPDGIAVVRSRAGVRADVVVDDDVDDDVNNNNNDVDGDGDVNAASDDPRRLLPEPIRERIALLGHDPADRQRLAYLAASESGEPILISRAIHDADLVLPIGCVRRPMSAGYFGIHGAVYPAFSDRRTLGRFRSPGSLSADRRQKTALTGEVDHVAWLLGINFTIQLVPAAGGSALHVVAGQSEAVRRRSGELYRAAWSRPVTARAPLVVAAIEGGPEQQHWQSFGHALEAAAELVEEGGSIAVCCDLAAPPGPAMQRLAGAPSYHDALRSIRKQRPPDALPAALLARTLQQAKVYLLSRLDAAVVEELDMIHVADAGELARLVRRHTSCILLANAPHAMVTLQEEPLAASHPSTK